MVKICTNEKKRIVLTFSLFSLCGSPSLWIFPSVDFANAEQTRPANFFSETYSPHPYWKCHDLYGLYNWLNIMEDLSWETFAVVLSGLSEKQLICARNALNLDQDFLPSVFYIMERNVSSSSLENDLLNIHLTLYPDINILLVSNNMQEVNSILMAAVHVDKTSNRTTDFAHHSRWIVSHFNTSDISFPAPVQLENIVLSEWSRSLATTKLYTKSGPGPKAPYTLVSNMTSHNMYPNRKYGYNNRRITVSVVPFPPYVYKIGGQGSNRYYGYSIDIVKALASALNFSFHIVEPQDEEWGELINGSWSGMVGQLHRREVDLTASDLTIHPDRAQVMDFLLPEIRTERVDIIYQKVERNDGNWTLLFDFVSPIVFLFILASILILPVLYVMFEVMHQLEYEDSLYDALGRQGVVAQLSLFWFTFGSILKQAYRLKPNSFANRVLVSFWWLFVLVLTSTYSAHFIANLSVKKSPQPFSNLLELLEHEDYSIGSTLGGITTTMLENSTVEDVRMLIARLKEGNSSLSFSMDFDAHIARVRKGQYAAVIYDSVYGMYLSRDCTLQTLGANIIYEPLAFGVPKHSPMKTDLERAMKSLFEAGLLNEWWRKWSNRSSEQCGLRLTEKRAATITLGQIGGGLALVCVGVAFAGLSLAGELFIQKLLCSNTV